MKRIYYYLEIENVSPIHIGNGQNDITDLDVIKDKNGQFFIPGTSIAGSIVHYLSEEERKIILPDFVIREYDDKLGKEIEIRQSKQSPLFISDARLLDDSHNLIETRDGIKLDENKITEKGAKYDYQIIPAHRTFQLLMEITDRDNQGYKNIMNKIFEAINNHDIQVGFKTTRGLGKLKITKLGIKEFNKDNFKDYFDFDRYDYDKYDQENIEETVSSKYTIIKAELTQKGGISIRTYNTSKDDVDYRHIHSNEKPVIPGTSWNGLIRKSLNSYIKDFHLDIDINELFGIANKKDEFTKKSKIIIEESCLSDGKKYIHTRIRINPFHGGTVNGALYNEESYYHGQTTLTIKIDNDLKDLELIKQLVLLFITDLNNGFLALGGETSIGRGLFNVDKIMINNQYINMSDYIGMEG